jgi:flavin-dependent dehydrogenase
VGYEVVVVGGGPAGLSAAAQLASRGHSVLLVEDDSEIGYPVKCAGIVSGEGLEVLGRACGRRIDGVRLNRGEVEVRGRGRLELDIGGIGALAVDRRAVERCLFDAAASRGVDFRLSERALEIGPRGVVTRVGRYAADVVVDARGAAAYPRRDRLIYATQYTCRARHMPQDGYIRILVDKAASREYFFWEVSLEGDVLVGGAGSSPASVDTAVNAIASGIDCAPYRIIRSPIVVGGFSGPGSGGIFRVGDSAGNAKPMTGGGDVLSVMASEMASQAISGYLTNAIGLADAYRLYERTWRSSYGKEESAQRILRELYEHLDDDDVWDILMRLNSAGALEGVSADFDRLGGWLLASLGVKVLAGMVSRRVRGALGMRGPSRERNL